MAYSYSRIATYKQCPLKYKFAYVDELPRGDQHPAAARGHDIHTSAEDYMNGKRDDVHLDILGYMGFLQQLKEAGAKAETVFAVDRDWKPCGYDDDDCYLRGKIDAELREFTTLYEFKTGKIYPEHAHQMHLYGTIKLVEWETEYVDVMAVYFDQGKDSTIRYHQHMLGEHKAQWRRLTDMIEDDTTWMANPQWLCRYCQFSKQQGGPCQF